jgi:hypothetical protein
MINNIIDKSNTNEQNPAMQLRCGAIAPIVSNNKEQYIDFNLTQIWKKASNVTDYQIVSCETLVDMMVKSESNPILINMRDLIKEYYSTGEERLKKEYDRLKTKLPLITFTSILKDYRSERYLREYTGYIVLDIDYQDNPELEHRFDVLRRDIQDDLCTCLCFASPKGKPYGLKIVVRVKLNERIKEINNLLKKDDLEPVEREKFIEEVKDFHKTAYKQVSKYYTEKYNFIGDSNAEALMGACFLSGDKEVYYNASSSLFNVAWVYCLKQKQVFNFTPIDNSLPAYEIMDKIINQFFKGEINGRNRTVFNLAMQVKYYGVSQNEVIQYSMNRFGASDFDEKEITRAVRNAFKNEYTPINQFIINQSNNEKIS